MRNRREKKVTCKVCTIVPARTARNVNTNRPCTGGRLRKIRKLKEEACEVCLHEAGGLSTRVCSSFKWPWVKLLDRDVFVFLGILLINVKNANPVLWYEQGLSHINRSVARFFDTLSVQPSLFSFRQLYINSSKYTRTTRQKQSKF